jgi:hypothetical protein
MIFQCFECQKEIQAYPCACGYSNEQTATGFTKSLAPVQSYEPMHEGCYIRKEEFGLNLYDTIKTIGGIIGLEQQRAAAIHYEHPEKIADLMTRRKALQVTLAGQLPKLMNHEVDQVLARYPWVTAC